ncbi:hypothetical protein SLE2022_020440 [Rubroshorea leprosula]
MERLGRFCFLAVIFLFMGLSVSSSSSSASSISDAVLKSYISSAKSRTLLQAPKECPVNFEVLNYTIITSKCKGPTYPASSCCAALKEFACPYTDQINDLSNNCATTMFSYISQNGHYPPGLFSSVCKEGKLGLACPADSPSAKSATANHAGGICSPSISRLLLIIVGLLFKLLG